MNDLTIDQVQAVVPKHFKGIITQELIDTINLVGSDPEIRDSFRENIISYTSVLSDGKFKIQSYLNAVAYMSYKLMGCSNEVAYLKTFTNKATWFQQQGTSSKDISSYVCAYNGSKLVNLIRAQTLIPSYILNADVYQKAINIQVELMLGANSEKVRSDAANSLLTHLKPPETTKIELDIGVKKDSAIEDLKNSIRELSSIQLKNVQLGISSVKDIANSVLVLEGEYTID